MPPGTSSMARPMSSCRFQQFAKWFHPDFLRISIPDRTFREFQEKFLRLPIGRLFRVAHRRRE